jgi:hypothetical protein
MKFLINFLFQKKEKKTGSTSKRGYSICNKRENLMVWKKGRKLHIDFLNRFKKSRSKNTLKRGLFFKPKKGQ